MSNTDGEKEPPLKRSRFDKPLAVPTDDFAAPAAPRGLPQLPVEGATPTQGGGRTPRWDSMHGGGATPRPLGEGLTPTPVQGGKTSRWGATPTPRADGNVWGAATPQFSASDKWGATPTMPSAGFGAQDTPMGNWGATPMMPGGKSPTVGSTFEGGTMLGHQPGGAAQGTNPQDIIDAALGPKHQRQLAEMKLRNRYMTDEELDELLPAGYEIAEVPDGYEGGGRTEEAPDDAEVNDSLKRRYNIPKSLGEGMPTLKPEDADCFKLLLEFQDVTEDSRIPADKLKRVQLLRALLKLKNGDGNQRRNGLRAITEKAQYFGSDLLFEEIFSLWKSGTLDDVQKHTLIKVIGRILFKLGTEVAAQAQNLLAVLQPLLSDPDSFTRDEGKEAIANLAKAAGMKPMCAALIQEVDHDDDVIRALTAKTLAIVTEALGVPNMIDFISAMCRSNKGRWLAKQTGVRVILDLAPMLGAACRKTLRQFVDVLEPCLQDENIKVKAPAAQAIAALADACYPYGIEEFNPVIPIIRQQVLQTRGKQMSSFLRAMGCMISLMSPHDGLEYTTAMRDVLLSSFTMPDEEFRRAVLRVVQQCIGNEGVRPDIIRSYFYGPYFEGFWNEKMVVDRRNAKQLIDTTVDMAKKLGASDVLMQLSERLRTQSIAMEGQTSGADNFQRVVIDSIQKVVETISVAHVSQDHIRSLIDTLIEVMRNDDTGNNHAVLHGLSAVCESLGERITPVVSQLLGLCLGRLSNPVSSVRRQAADFMARLAPVVQSCNQIPLLTNVSVLLVERLGREDEAEALAACAKALRAIVEVVPPDQFRPSLGELAQHLQPIIKNPSENVQEQTIQLIGSVARAAQGTDLVHPAEFFKIATEGLFYLLKSKRKTTRVLTSIAFGEIATAINPTPIVKQLLDNLRKDDRTERICTEVALAIIAKTCQPFVVIPFLVNEYSATEGIDLAMQTQQAILKTLRFIFEYLGAAGSKYVYAVVPLLERALTERKIEHRRMATEVVRHMALCVAGQEGYEDAFIHLLNFIQPNIVEPPGGSEQLKMICATVEAYEACRLVVGPAYVLQSYVIGMFHPARVVRATYWRAYNNLYLSAQDALVPFYPVINDEDIAGGEAVAKEAGLPKQQNVYARHHLRVIV